MVTLAPQVSFAAYLTLAPPNVQAVLDNMQANTGLEFETYVRMISDPSQTGISSFDASSALTAVQYYGQSHDFIDVSPLLTFIQAYISGAAELPAALPPPDLAHVSRWIPIAGSWESWASTDKEWQQFAVPGPIFVGPPPLHLRYRSYFMGKMAAYHPFVLSWETWPHNFEDYLQFAADYQDVLTRIATFNAQHYKGDPWWKGALAAGLVLSSAFVPPLFLPETAAAAPIPEAASVVTEVAAPTALTATLPEGSAVLEEVATSAAAEPIVSLGPAAELTATIPEGQLALISSQAALAPTPIVIPESTLTATLPESQLELGGVTPPPAPAPPSVPSTPSLPSKLAQQAQKVVTNVATGQATRLVQQGIYDLTRSEPAIPIGYAPAGIPPAPAGSVIGAISIASVALYLVYKIVGIAFVRKL